MFHGNRDYDAVCIKKLNIGDVQRRNAEAGGQWFSPAIIEQYETSDIHAYTVRGRVFIICFDACESLYGVGLWEQVEDGGVKFILKKRLPRRFGMKRLRQLLKRYSLYGGTLDEGYGGATYGYGGWKIVQDKI